MHVDLDWSAPVLTTDIRAVVGVVCLIAASACGPDGPSSELTVLSTKLGVELDVPPADDGYWASILVEIDNASSRDLPLVFAAFRLTGLGGISHDASVSTELFGDGCHAGTYVTSHSTGSCRLAFELSDGEVPLSISYREPGGDTHLTADIEICPPDKPDLCGFDCADLTTDLDNCGACGVKAEIECVDGTPECGDLTQCPEGCVDLRIHPFNCGECRRFVPEHGRCVDGEIVCDAPYQACNEQCLDLSSDDENCGACGAPVVGNETQCIDGMAVCTDPTLALCGEECTDLSLDADNCGGCGLKCPIPDPKPVTLDFSCDTGQSCEITFPNPGGTCTDRCGSNGWECAYLGGGGYCICDSNYGMGECDCRCLAPLSGP